MKKQDLSLFLLLVLTADLASASNRPGSGGGCDGAGPTLGLGSGGPPGAGGAPGAAGGGGGGPPGTGGPPVDPNAGRFLREVAKPATKRHMQSLTIDGRPFSDDDIDRCCSGNGDFAFLMGDLDVSGQAIATEAEGFKEIPGDSLTCRAGCRDPANGFLDDLETCYAACDCRQDCPTTIDYLTTQCTSTCAVFAADSLENELCLTECYIQCEERCRSTMNGYVVPLDIYAQGLDILDCYHGDLNGDPATSCANGQQFWQGEGYTCTVAEGSNFDCECDIPNTCLSVLYPCDYEYYCVSQSPSFVQSDQPTTVPSTSPTASPLKSSSSSEAPVVPSSSSKGKGKGGKRYDDDDDDDDGGRRRSRRIRRTGVRRGHS